MQRITGFTPSFEHTYSPPAIKQPMMTMDTTDSELSDTEDVGLEVKLDCFALLSDPSYDSTVRRLTRQDRKFIEHVINSENIRKECKKRR
jgi:hypothetical protein